jgi:hypothetical protein
MGALGAARAAGFSRFSWLIIQSGLASDFHAARSQLIEAIHITAPAAKRNP